MKRASTWEPEGLALPLAIPITSGRSITSPIKWASQDLLPQNEVSVGKCRKVLLQRNKAKNLPTDAGQAWKPSGLCASS